MKASNVFKSLLKSHEAILFILIITAPAIRCVLSPCLGDTIIHDLCISITEIPHYEEGLLAILSIFLAGIVYNWKRMNQISFPKHEIDSKKMVNWPSFEKIKATYLAGVIWCVIFTLTLLFSLDIGSPIQSCSFLILSSIGYAVAFVTNYFAVEKVEETYHKYSDSDENANKP